MKNKQILITFGLIFIAASSRLLKLPFNFTAVTAVALFSGAILGNRLLSFATPLIAMFISDLVVNNIFYASLNTGFVWFTYGFYWMYGSFALIVLLSSIFLSKVNVIKVGVGSLFASGLFFAITNFGVWMGGSLYPKTLEGLAMCYTAAIPFFGNSIMGDLVFSSILFGSYAWALKNKLVLSFLSAKA